MYSIVNCGGGRGFPNGPRGRPGRRLGDEVLARKPDPAVETVPGPDGGGTDDRRDGAASFPPAAPRERLGGRGGEGCPSSEKPRSRSPVREYPAGAGGEKHRSGRGPGRRAHRATGRGRGARPHSLRPCRGGRGLL